MSVTIRPYVTGGWEVDIRFRQPDGTVIRERTKMPAHGEVSGDAVGRGARARALGRRQTATKPAKQQEENRRRARWEEFAVRFLDGYARANRQKPSGIAAKETIVRVHLVPALRRTRRWTRSRPRTCSDSRWR